SAGGLTALERADCRPREVRRIDDAQSAAVASEPDTVVGTTTTSPALAEIDADSPVSTVPDAPDRNPQDDAEADDAPAPVLPAQNVVPVFRKGTLGEAQLDALRTIAGELTTSDLTELRARVDEGDDPEAVAREWIDEHAGAWTAARACERRSVCSARASAHPVGEEGTEIAERRAGRGRERRLQRRAVPPRGLLDEGDVDARRPELLGVLPHLRVEHLRGAHLDESRRQTRGIGVDGRVAGIGGIAVGEIRLGRGVHPALVQNDV